MLGLTLGATFASPSTPLVIGVNEDHPKFQEDAGATMFGELSTIGLTESVISVRWDPAQPETIPDEAQLAAVIAAAKEKGVKVVLALYPAKARAVADNGPAGFVDFCGRAATAFPEPRRSSSATSRTSRASGSRNSMRTEARPRPQPS